jgi:hypothetical protein
VPHNRDVLLDWRGHANVEYAGSCYSVLYLFKYLHKGNKKVKVNLDVINTDGIDKGDEIGLYLRGRMMCSMEATWRVLGYQTYPSSYPAVKLVKPKLPSVVDFFSKDDKTCDMALYFARPLTPQFVDLKYTDFFCLWDISKSLPVRFKPRGKLHDRTDCYFQITVPGIQHYLWLYKRANPEDCVVRMSNVFITAGELWYLRLILLNVPCGSFLDAKTVNGVVYDTFQAAAIARGLYSDNTEAIMCYTEALTHSTPYQLRSLLVRLTLQGYPTLSIFDDPEMKMTMMEDFYMNNNQSLELASSFLLSALHEKFKEEDKDGTTYGFPPPEQTKTELEIEKLRYDMHEQEIILKNLHMKVPNTDEQDTLYQIVTSKLDAMSRGGFDQDGVMYFVQGQGGYGKSIFAKKLLAFARSQCHT